ncbi:LysR family transcriptional regulator [Paraferrimonas sedimenticola]|uniref:HTH lysR-type domain-containing protein n=1 Tax=Paraferrimonas sedimenticola TaxID=375674 RepID=A0AA37RX27_9GAMM|nr:LysR family transcriptional regulator [Paraferrimonas sedimenticola]GLP96302.1 hypothetical protein GCM10007895_16080 [Paraferrimonas sedimenticola]
MDYSLSQLQAFVHTFETGSFKEAAVRLNKRRQVVARSVAMLEEICNITIFERHVRHLEVTDEGRKLYQYAKRVLRDLHQFDEQLASFNRQLPNEFRLAVDLSLSCPQISNCYLGALEEIPTIDLQVLSGGTKQCIEWVQGGVVEMALLFSPVLNFENLQNVTVLDFELVEVASPQEINAGQVLSENEIADMTQIVPQFIFDYGHENAHIDSDKVIKVNNMQESINMIRAGVGWARVPKFIAQPYVDAQQINSFSRMGGLSASWYAEVLYPSDESLSLAGDIFLSKLMQLQV